MKEKAVIKINQATKRLMKTLSQVRNQSIDDLWEEAAVEFLAKNYSIELRKAAKSVSELFKANYESPDKKS